MVTTSWQLTCAGSRAEVMALLSDVTRAAEWTPAMRSASKTTAGPIASGTEFDSVMDLGGRATPVAWKVKKFEPPLTLVLKGKAKYDAKQWYWPAKIKVKLVDKYYVQEGPSNDSCVVECFSHTEAKGLDKLLLPKFKAEWRAVKDAAREGLARRQGRPAEAEPAAGMAARATSAPIAVA